MRLFVQIGLSVAVVYTALGAFVGPDMHWFLFPWLAHIREAGTIGAFAEPFSNYTPPYLYLLTAISMFGLSPLVTIKLLSSLGNLWMAWCLYRLLTAGGCTKALEAAALSLLLPTVFLNGPFLGQCDGLWVGCCLLAVAAAAERRIYAMALWAGLGFAFKAQALFIAPFCVALVRDERKWPALLIPPAVYLLAILPAWLAGWPLSNLLTIYARQYDYLDWLSKAPNIWALPYMLGASGAWFTIAYLAAFGAIIAYLWRPPKPVLVAALLSAIIVPYFLPKMHERYFLLADLLAFGLAYVDRRGVPIFAAVQIGSLLSLLSYATAIPALHVAGGVLMTAALILVLRIACGSGAISADHEPSSVCRAQ